MHQTQKSCNLTFYQGKCITALPSDFAPETKCFQQGEVVLTSIRSIYVLERKYCPRAGVLWKFALRYCILERGIFHSTFSIGQISALSIGKWDVRKPRKNLSVRVSISQDSRSNPWRKLTGVDSLSTPLASVTLNAARDYRTPQTGLGGDTRSIVDALDANSPWRMLRVGFTMLACTVIRCIECPHDTLFKITCVLISERYKSSKFTV
jgi:hypothetical protein